MNNTLAAVAASALFTGSAICTAEVALYGRLHMSLDYVNSDSQPAPGQDKRNLNVASNASRLGFKGREALGDGLQAIWQIESQFGLDDGTGQWAFRDSFVGLSGGLGTVFAGRHMTPYTVFGRKLDPFLTTVADTRAVLGTSPAGTPLHDLRASSVVAYLTPDLRGFSVLALYSADPGASTTDPGPLGGNAGADNNQLDLWSASGSYGNGPLFLGAAYQTRRLPGGRGDTQAWRIGGSYKLGPAKLGGLFEQEIDVPVSAAAKGDRNAFSVFATLEVPGSNTAKLAYTDAGSYDNTRDTGASMYAVAVDHRFSKRTTVYVQYTRLENDANATYRLGGNVNFHGDAVTTNPGANPDAVSLGIVHLF